ncbi:MAG: PqqD family protein [Acidimicrobiales bacterium]
MTSQDAPEVEESEQRWRIREDAVVWRRVVEDMVLLDVDRSVYHSLNPTGTLLWQGIADHLTEGELVDLLVAEFPEASEEAARDVPGFLEALSAAGLIETDSGTRDGTA